MQFWDNIVHAALLGTDKKQLKKDDLPGDLAEASTLIATENDKESFYLGIAVIAASYRKCGVVPINKEVTRTVSNEESKVYCSNAALTLLNDIMSLDNNPLLLLWLQQCNSAGQLVLPELIPTLFDLAMRHKALQQEIVMVTGERGEWLRSLNRNWQFDSTAIDENIWETGSLDQRKWLLRELGKTDPAKAKEDYYVKPGHRRTQIQNLSY